MCSDGISGWWFHEGRRGPGMLGEIPERGPSCEVALHRRQVVAADEEPGSAPAPATLAITPKAHIEITSL